MTTVVENKKKLTTVEENKKKEKKLDGVILTFLFGKWLVK